MSMALSLDLRRRVLAAVREEGLSHRQAAERFRVSAASVSRWRRLVREKGDPRPGPLGAYDAETDRFLVLDVSRYKYPPVWVEAAALFDAMNTPDSDNADKTRGYLMVGR